MTCCAEAEVREPLVSVCIANYNGERLLDDCLTSVYAQALDGPVEVLIHDDASVDGSIAMLRERHSQVGVIQSVRNVGFCISNNRLVQRARGEFVLLLNNDAALRPGALAALVETARASNELAISTLPQYDWASGQLVDRGVRLDFMYAPVANRNSGCTRLAYVQGACLFLRRSAWERLGGFPEWMVSNAEDTYLCLAARLKGGDVYVVEQSGYDHRQGTSLGGNRAGGKRLQTTYRRRYLSERNRACIVLVCTPGWAAWPWFVAHVSLLLFEGLVVSLMAWDRKIWTSIYLSAVSGVIRLLPELKRARQEVQSGRLIGFWAYVRLFDRIPQKLRVLFRYGLPRLR